MKKKYKTSEHESLCNEPAVAYQSQVQPVIQNQMSEEEDLNRAISGSELLKRLLPRIEEMFKK